LLRVPRGERRAVDVIRKCIKVMRTATGGETDELEADQAKSVAAELGSRAVRHAQLLKLKCPKKIDPNVSKLLWSNL
jgi:hypothetical protein